MPKRSETHGERMSMESGLPGIEEAVGDIHVVHCCACWQYTDDMTREGNLLHAATNIACQSAPSVEQSDAYKAAQEYLVTRFKCPTAQHTTMKVPSF